MKETVLQWKTRVEMVGPFAPLVQLEELLESAPSAAQKTRDYIYLEGVIAGRMIYERFGGVAVAHA